MTKNSKDYNQITALQTELASVKAELIGLQNGRAVRIAKFIRQIISSRPKEAVKILKTAPSLIKRYDPPSPDEFLVSKGRFSSVHDSSPLLKHPNINVAIVGDMSTDVFGNTCNSFPLGGPSYKDLVKYEAAIQLIAIDADRYQKDKHKDYIDLVLRDGGKLVVLFNKEDECNQLKSDFTDNIYFVKFDQVEDFIDIYEVEISLPDPKVNRKPKAFSKNEKYHTQDIILLPSELLEKASKSKLLRLDIIKLIASGKPVVAEGQAVNWLPKETLYYNDENDLESIIDQLSKPYIAERYAISISRDVILNKNALSATEALFTQVGINSINSHEDISIGVILSTRRPKNIRSILTQIEKQSIKPKQVALLLHGASDSEFKNASEIVAKSSLNIEMKLVDATMIFGEVLNTGLDMLDTEYVTKIDDDDYYGPNHLLDLYVAKLHTGADFVGKWNNWVHIESDKKTYNWVPEYRNKKVRHLPGGTFLVKTSTLKQLRFGLVRRAIDSELFRRAEKRGAVLYSTYRYNYVRKRGDDHTYKTSDADFKSRSNNIVVDGLPLEDILFV